MSSGGSNDLMNKYLFKIILTFPFNHYCFIVLHFTSRVEADHAKMLKDAENDWKDWERRPKGFNGSLHWGQGSSRSCVLTICWGQEWQRRKEEVEGRQNMLKIQDSTHSKMFLAVVITQRRWME